MMIRKLPATVRSPHRTGYVLFAVLIVVVVLSLVAFQYADAMSSQYQAAVRAHEAEQAKANAVSGVHWACSVIADPNNVGANLVDNSGFFAAQPVGDPNGSRGGGRFSIFNVSDFGDGTNNYAIRYGLSDESGKINVNAIIQLDPSGQVLHDMLMKLPGMTEDIADAIVDWVDADDTMRPAGAENDYYTGLSPAYRIKNGPVNSLEELLLVRGVTPDLLFGADRNRNGQMDGIETATDSGFTRGWSEFLTCYGRELNTDSTGVARVNLNGTDPKTLSAQLTAIVGQELSDYILYFRLSGNSETVQPILPANKVSAPVSALRDLVQGQLDSGAQPKRRINSLLTIVGTQIPLPKAPMSPPNAPTSVVGCPVNDLDSIKKVAQVMLDKCTTLDDYEMTPRINLFTAPKEVLAALPGLTDTDAAAMVSARPAPGGTDDTSAWLLNAASLDPLKFRNIEKYVTGRSGAYRLQSVGYFGQPGGPVGRVEAVIEFVITTDASQVTTGKPRIVYFRDLSDMGRGFNELPR